LYEKPKGLFILADILRMSGDHPEGLNCLEEADAIVREVGLGQWTPEIYRLWGDLLVNESRPVEAEEQLRKAIEVAFDQRAKTFELRAATSLARLWRDQGRLTRIIHHRPDGAFRRRSRACGGVAPVAL
jgi:tetratricopeptide (TPR) repeat protein